MGVLSCFTEFTFFHTLTDEPVDESAFAVHHIKLPIESIPSLSNSSGIRTTSASSNIQLQHSNRSIGLRLIPRIRNNGLLIINAQLESSRTPIDKLNRPARLDLRDGLVGITGDDITAVQECTGHVMGSSGVTDDHLVMGLEALEGDILDAVGFVLSLGFGDDGCAGDKWVVDSGVGNEISLEFG